MKMSGFCYETHPLGTIIRRPKLAMDAAPNGNGALINALQKFAVAELTPDLAAKLNILIEDNTNPRAAVAQDDPPPFEDQPKSGAPRKIDPENLERAIDLARSKGIDEETIDKIRKIAGVNKPSQAQDSARRERNRERDEADYYRRFPETRRLSSENGITFDHAPDVAKRRREAEAVSHNAAGYYERFPEAKRIVIG
jgi:hypothetical protein